MHKLSQHALLNPILCFNKQKGTKHSMDSVKVKLTFHSSEEFIFANLEDKTTQNPASHFQTFYMASLNYVHIFTIQEMWIVCFYLQVSF